MATVMKKLINDPYAVSEELIDGYVRAYRDQVRRAGATNAVVRVDAPIPGKVAIVTGGGSGHEPLFHGFVGPGMADASAPGGFFAAPPPDVILEAVHAADGGAGVVFIYGNYAGDRLNFEMAEELVRDEGITVQTVRVWDDVASATKGRESERRGTAADLFVIKAAGAVSARGADFAEVVRVTEKARDNCRSIGVSLSPCTVPATGRPTFELGDDEMEVGMGLHGEAGVRKTKLLSANETADLMAPLVLQDLPFLAGDEVLLLINGYGATTQMEMFILYRRFEDLLQAAGIGIYGVEIGNYCTTQEMAGCSLTLMRLDEELKALYDAPAWSPGYCHQGRAPAAGI